MTNYLNVNQVASECDLSSGEIMDAVRAGVIEFYTVAGEIHFVNGKPVFHRDQVRVSPIDAETFKREYVSDPDFPTFIDRQFSLYNIHDDPEINGPYALNLFKGALTDDPTDRYARGVVDALSGQFG